jgi:hypothetical protein
MISQNVIALGKQILFSAKVETATPTAAQVLPPGGPFHSYQQL